MDGAKDLADLIQVSMEDDVDDITTSEGHDQKAWLNVAKDNRSYKVIIIQQEGVIDEDAEDDTSEDLTEMAFEDA